MKAFKLAAHTAGAQWGVGQLSYSTLQHVTVTLMTNISLHGYKQQGYDSSMIQGGLPGWAWCLVPSELLTKRLLATVSPPWTGRLC